MITHSIDIARRPEDVFAYLDQFERHGEWQTQIVSAKVETDGPVRVGTQVHEVRKIGGREQDTSFEIIDYDPPHRSSFKGTVGPVRPVGTVTVDPLGDGEAARVTIEFDLVGQGIGKLMAPLARMQARKTIPESQEQLKARLEAGA
jgi:uncharacterized protein YndB with AHSA1/START domain